MPLITSIDTKRLTPVKLGFLMKKNFGKLMELMPREEVLGNLNEGYARVWTDAASMTLDDLAGEGIIGTEVQHGMNGE